MKLELNEHGAATTIIALLDHIASEERMMIGDSEKKLNATIQQLRDELAAAKKDHAALIDVMDKLETIIGQAVGLSGSGPLYDAELLVKELAKAKTELSKRDDDFDAGNQFGMDVCKQLGVISCSDVYDAIDQLKQRAERAERELNTRVNAINSELIQSLTAERNELVTTNNRLTKERDEALAKVKQLEHPDAKPVGYINEKFPNEEYTTGCIVSEQVKGYTIPVYLHPQQQPGEVLFSGVRYFAENDIERIRNWGKYIVDIAEMSREKSGHYSQKMHVTIRKAGA